MAMVASKDVTRRYGSVQFVDVRVAPKKLGACDRQNVRADFGWWNGQILHVTWRVLHVK